MRVAIVNDASLAREALRRAILNMPGYSVAWTAVDGADAVKKCEVDNPDLVLMDLVMPVMDGVAATRTIMANTPCPILVVAATVGENGSRVLEALSAGALDAVQTPALNPDENSNGVAKLQQKLETIRRLVSKSAAQKKVAGTSAPRQTSSLIVIGASAGGPAAIAAILQKLPAGFPIPIVLVQHIDAQFAPSMANWLNDQSALTVRVAKENDSPQAGTALLAAGNEHLVFKNSLSLSYTKEPSQCHYRPSVDVFFESVAKHWRGPVTAVLLTGMGRDGACGLKSLRQAGAFTIAQDAASCVVFGMPKAAVEIGAAAEVLPVQSIGSCLLKLSENRGTLP